MRKPILKPAAVVTAAGVELSWLKSTPLFQDRNTDEFNRFRILRQECDFVFGEDYEEYFLGLDANGSRLIHDGPIEPLNQRRYTHLDTGAAVGCTYAYWIQTWRSPPVGPIPVRVRDPRIWWPYASLMRRLTTLRDTFPDLVSLDMCGETACAVPIPRLCVGAGPRTIGLVGLIHGGESGPELIVPVLERLLRERPELLHRVRIVAVPAVNIDAREAAVRGTPWYLRTNHQGVDLNRNFPADWERIEYGYGLDSSSEGSSTYRGPRPAGAPETRAVMAAFDDCRPAAVFSYHALASVCGLPALAARAGAGCDAYVQACRRMIDIFGPGIDPDCAGRERWLAFNCSAGSLPAWFYENGRVPAFDLEEGINPGALAQCRRDGTDLALLNACRIRHFNAVAAVAAAVGENEPRVN